MPNDEELLGAHLEDLVHLSLVLCDALWHFQMHWILLIFCEADCCDIAHFNLDHIIHAILTLSIDI